MLKSRSGLSHTLAFLMFLFDVCCVQYKVAGNGGVPRVVTVLVEVSSRHYMGLCGPCAAHPCATPTHEIRDFQAIRANDGMKAEGLFRLACRLEAREELQAQVGTCCCCVMFIRVNSS